MFEVPEQSATRKVTRVSSGYQSSPFQGDIRTIPAVAERFWVNLGGSRVLPSHSNIFALKECGGSTTRPESASENNVPTPICLSLIYQNQIHANTTTETTRSGISQLTKKANRWRPASRNPFAHASVCVEIALGSSSRKTTSSTMATKTIETSNACHTKG